MNDRPPSRVPPGATPAVGATPQTAGEPNYPETPGATPGTDATSSPQETPNFDSWLATQEEPVKQLVAARFAVLEDTLQTERSERKSLAKQLKDLSGKLDADSEAAKQLATITANMEAERKRADFYEQATVAGCVKPKLAYLAAQADGLTVEQVKVQYPELFAQARAAPPPPVYAGNGTQAPPAVADTMDTLIRRAAGRR
jgi:hypothetical protein